MEKLTHLYRLRVLFDENDRLSLAETVEKTVIVDGDRRHAAGEVVRTFDVDKVDLGLVRALVAHLIEVGDVMAREAEVKKAQAEAERAAAEAAAKKADVDARATVVAAETARIERKARRKKAKA